MDKNTYTGRPIKFRGLSINGSWFVGLLSHSIGGVHHAVPEGWYISNKAGMPWAYQVRPETLGQFVGLTDKNGKEIYEGDILMDQYEDKMDDPPIVKIYYPVVFKDGCLGWIGENSGAFHNFHDNPLEGIQVIGNIHEDSHLLNQKRP